MDDLTIPRSVTHQGVQCLCNQGSTSGVLNLNRFLFVLIFFDVLEMKAVNDATVSTSNKIYKNILSVVSCNFKWCYLYKVMVFDAYFLGDYWWNVLREVTSLSHYFPTVNMFSLILIFSVLLHLYCNDKLQTAGRKDCRNRRVM